MCTPELPPVCARGQLGGEEDDLGVLRSCRSLVHILTLSPWDHRKEGQRVL